MRNHRPRRGSGVAPPGRYAVGQRRGRRLGAPVGLAALVATLLSAVPPATAAADPTVTWPALAAAVSTHGDIVAFTEVRPAPGSVEFVFSVRDRGRDATAQLGAPVPAQLGIQPAVAVSGNGRYATAYLASPPTTGTADAAAPFQLALYDLSWDRYEPVSVDPAGNPGDDISTDPAISADGRYVAFSSYAANLVAGGDHNGAWDVFVRDRTTGRTRRASLTDGDAEGDAGSLTPAVSLDGRYVAFASDATNLVPGDSNGVRDVFVRDLRYGTTHRLSVDSRGGPGDGQSDSPAISADGRYVVFSSDATDLVRGDSNGVRDVFVRDLRYGTTHRLSVDSRGGQGDGAAQAATISADGRYVAFGSDATDLVAGDTNGLPDVFVRDLRYGITRRASLDAAGNQVTGLAGNPVLSGDGRYLAFSSDSAGLIPEYVPPVLDVFVRDLWGHVNYRVNRDTV